MKYRLSGNSDEGYEIMGIFCHEKDYKLAFLFNDTLDFSFKKFKNLSRFFNPIEETIEFSLYYWYDEMNRIGYHLISNRSQNIFLISEKNKIVYILISKAESSRIHLAERLKPLKRRPEILGILEFKSPKKLTDFFQDLEIHMTQLKKEEKKPEEEVKKRIQMNQASRRTNRKL